MPTGATLLADTLVELGVHDVLGIPGTIDLEFYDAIFGRDDIRPFLVRQEQAAAFAAEAFGKVSGRPAVCLAVPGPGTTNLSSGVASALGDSIPLIAITVQVPAVRRGRHAIHDLDIDTLYRPLVKAQFRIGAATDVPDVLREAYLASLSGRPGPVQVLLPADVLSQPVEVEQGERPSVPPAEAPGPGDQDLLARAAEMLAGARSPIVYVGAGALGARDEVMEIADRLDAPVLTSFCGRGLLPEDDPRCVGPLSFPGTAEVIAAADACLAIGTCFSEYATFGWRTRLPENLVRIDVDPTELSRSYPSRIGLVGDARTMLTALLAALPKRADQSPIWPVVKQGQTARASAVAAMAAVDPGQPLHPGWVTRTIREVCPDQTIFTSDASATQGWLFEPFFPVRGPRRLLTDDVFQAMGYALPAAIGARLAEPESPVVAITGDGSLTMALPEIATAVAARLSLVVVVYNDGVYNALRLTQERRYQGRYIAVDTGGLDFARLAREFGAEGVAVREAGELAPAVTRAIAAEGVTVLDVAIDPRQRPTRWQ